MMKIILKRLTHKTDEKKIAERYILNTTYEPDINQQLLVYPIPEFIDPKCSCGKEGFGMVDYKVYCKDCLNNIVGNIKMKQEKTLVCPSVTQNKNGNAFEWQIQGKNEAWYKIRGINITCDSNQRLSIAEINRRFDELMLKILEDNAELCDAEYKKETKILTVYV
jgi:hypothetical protein